MADVAGCEDDGDGRSRRRRVRRVMCCLHGEAAAPLWEDDSSSCPRWRVVRCGVQRAGSNRVGGVGGTEVAMYVVSRVERDGGDIWRVVVYKRGALLEFESAAYGVSIL